VTQYIDEPYLSGVLAGVVLGVAALWIVVVANKLWRSALRPYAAGVPFELREAGFGASLSGEGMVDGRRVRVRLTAGLRGPRARIDDGEDRRVVDLAEAEPESWFSQLS